METQNGSGFSTLQTLFSIVVVIFTIACLWRVFTKAGQPGWAVLIPIFNLYLLCKIAGKPGWWVLLMLIPCVNVIIALLVALGVADQFRKGPGFGIGLFLLPMIFYAILAWGDAQYGGTPELSEALPS